MIQTFVRVTLWAVLIWAAGQLVLVASADADEYVVSRGTVIESQRPIWLLVTEAGLGVIDGLRTSPAGATRRPLLDSELSDLSSSLRIDGRPAPGIGGMVSAAWRLVGFIVWDADGEISRVTRATVRGHSVEIRDRVRDGRVGLVVTVGPPLGDPRVRYAVLDLSSVETKFGTVITITLSAEIRTRCKLVGPIVCRVAGNELTKQVYQLEAAGRSAVHQGRNELTEITERFVTRVVPTFDVRGVALSRRTR